MKVLDLFAGLGGWSAAFRDRGHEVVTLDLNPKFKTTIVADLLALDIDDLATHGPFDVVLASPPCEHFCVPQMGANWERSPSGSIQGPKSDGARLAIRLVERTLQIIDHLAPSYWYMENPRAALRKMPVVVGLPAVQVSYCSYGRPYQKATDLWGHFAPSWRPRAFCQAQPRHGVSDSRGLRWFVKEGYLHRPEDDVFVEIPKDGRPIMYGEPCTMRVLTPSGQPCHEWAPRGAKTGIQGVAGSADRAVIPYDLSLDVALACEDDLAGGSPPSILHPYQRTLGDYEGQETTTT